MTRQKYEMNDTQMCESKWLFLEVEQNRLSEEDQKTDTNEYDISKIVEK